jgi:hypothetical protein
MASKEIIDGKPPPAGAGASFRSWRGRIQRGVRPRRRAPELAGRPDMQSKVGATATLHGPTSANDPPVAVPIGRIYLQRAAPRGASG